MTLKRIDLQDIIDRFFDEAWFVVWQLGDF